EQGTGTAFSLGTLSVNLTGAFGLGFFATWMLDRTEISPELQLAITVGFFGSYTTFSTYELEATALLIADNWPIALLYWAGTAVLGVLCLEAGSQLAKKLLL
ncbi:MAG: CrcB family protein, partial [Phormidesmis sp.]